MVTCSEQKEFFRENGYLSGINVCSVAEAAYFRDCFDQLERVEGKEMCAMGLLDRHFDQRFIWELASHPKIVESLQEVLGPDIVLLATHFFCKYGPEEKFVAWHQDVTYWGLEPPQAVTAWYAVDDADQENGCMRVIPCSHRDGIRQHGKSDREGNLLSINQEVPVDEAEEQRACDVVLQAGQMSLHDGTLIHGSLPNRSSRRRCGLTLRYSVPSVRQVEKNSLGQSWRTVLVSGEDRYGHFERVPAPFCGSDMGPSFVVQKP
ncbi:MAG: phytanoyl-CoA dioxygenase family protein [Pirellulales bacterium]